MGKAIPEEDLNAGSLKQYLMPDNYHPIKQAYCLPSLRLLTSRGVCGLIWFWFCHVQPTWYNLSKTCPPWTRCSSDSCFSLAQLNFWRLTYARSPSSIQITLGTKFQQHPQPIITLFPTQTKKTRARSHWRQCSTSTMLQWAQVNRNI